MQKIPKDLSEEVYGKQTFTIPDEEENAEKPRETETREEEETNDETEEAKIHPITVVIDSLVKTSEGFCKSKKLPPPDNNAYINLARPNLNEAFWDIMPESSEKMNPYIVLIIGLGAMILVYLPIITSIFEKKLLESDQKKVDKNKAEKLRESETREADEEKPYNPGLKWDGKVSAADRVIPSEY